MEARYAAIRANFEGAGQGHCLAHWSSLNPSEQEQLLVELEKINLGEVTRLYKQSQETASGMNYDALQACPTSWFGSSAASPASDRASWEAAGLDAIHNGRVGFILLAGGQGTRLGFNAPKGMYDIGLPSHKSLFQLQSERIIRMQRASNREIPWYIMTSPFTHADTVSFFKENNYFGLASSQVMFFEQGTLPAFTKDGKIIMASPGHVQVAPNGNGGIFVALEEEGILADMRRRGLLGVVVYSVDNALIKVADPLFSGFCIANGCDVAAKVVAKAYPGERVGMFAELDGKLQTVEYSELPESKSHSPAFGHGNIAIHWFSVPFLERCVGLMAADVKYHVALKAIDSVDGKVDGIKLESFIFDVFPYATTPRLFEVVREQEFAPVKNKPGSPTDSPDTARKLFLSLHKSWVQAPCDIEISPLVSAYGEGLVDNESEAAAVRAAVQAALSSGKSAPLQVTDKQNGSYVIV
jgi:UDP-N-acetylglucosamine/UDP-N-acetylgalactosamine diphosphorylase